jgi:uncharacterized DUF497 family protein
MQIAYDPNKDLLNINKHGVSLSLADSLEWDWLQAMPDNRYDYGECRMIGYAPIGNHVYCVVYVDRLHHRRIISLRKATKREVQRYVRNINP